MRVPLPLEIAVVAIQPSDFMDLDEARSAHRRGTHFGVEFALDQRVTRVFAATAQPKRSSSHEKYATPYLCSFGPSPPMEERPEVGAGLAKAAARSVLSSTHAGGIIPLIINILHS